MSLNSVKLGAAIDTLQRAKNNLSVFFTVSNDEATAGTLDEIDRVLAMPEDSHEFERPARRPWADRVRPDFEGPDQDYVAFLDWFEDQVKDRFGSSNLNFYQLMYEAYEGHRPGSEAGDRL